MVATDYIETGASTAQAGILEDLPRLDYSGGASCPSLLLEPLRTNAVPYSEYYDTGWGKVGCSVTSNAVTSPDGLQNATKLVEDTSTGKHMLSYANLYVVGAGNDNYLTLYAKEGERRYLAISSRGNFSNNDNTLIFDTRDGVWANNDSGQNTGQDPVDVGNGWWRIQILNESSSAAYDGFGIGIAEAGDNWDDASYTGDGSSGIYIWGAQAEIGSYPTSYIPTMGSAVTRSGDSCVAASVTDLIGQEQGTIYWEGSVPTADQNSNICQYNNDTNSSVVLEKRSNGKIRARIWNSGSAIVGLQSSAYGDENLKIAFAYASGDIALYINGTQIATDTTAFSFTQSLSEFQLGVGILFFAYPQTSKAKQSLLFKTRLTNAELAALTA
jgi:hypothetical protein